MVDVTPRVEPGFLGDEHVAIARRAFRPTETFGRQSPRSVTARGLDDHFDLLDAPSHRTLCYELGRRLWRDRDRGVKVSWREATI